MASSIATFELWQRDNPEGTREQYNQITGSHNALHWRADQEGMPCPYGSNCPGYADREPKWGLMRRTLDRIHGREDPWGDYGIDS